MQVTGYIRHVDDYGRIGIPKELRRQLKIHENDPLEIFVSEGGILFKKYSYFAPLKNLAQSICKAASLSGGATIFITDLDTVIAASPGHDEVVGKRLSKDIDTLLSTQRLYKHSNESKVIYIDEEGTTPASYVMPILYDGESMGAVIAFSDTEASENICRFTARFLQGQFVDY